MNITVKGSRFPIFWLLFFTLLSKTYIVSRFIFQLQIESILQEIILLLACVGSVLFIQSIALFGNQKSVYGKLIAINLTLTALLYFNLLYYRFFNDFITIPVLFQTDNAGDLGSSIIELINVFDSLLFVDLILVTILVILKRTQINEVSKGIKKKIVFSAISILVINMVMAHIERPQLLTRSFDRQMLVKNLGIFNYQLYDLIIQSKTKAKRAFADSDEITEIINYTRANQEKPSEKMFGIAKGKNVFVISLESTQNFVINRTLDGQVLTPFLNQLIKEQGTYYFNNFYHQTGQGKTSDSEFIVENSLYGLPSGAVYFTHSQNEYQGTPKILKKQLGYYSAVFHANNRSFWNRDVMYNTLGYNRYFSEEYFDITEDNSIGWGLKDDVFFDQSFQYLKSLPQPFYVKYITLTNHFPFSLEQEDEIIPEWTSESGTVNRYFTTIRYQDEALKQFFERLKEDGLYQNSIFILYGDHYGISKNHNEAMGQLLGKEITPFEETELQKVPFIIHIPGMKENETIETVGGQIDVQPTLLNLLGIKMENNIEFGSDLFAESQDNLVIRRDGSFITENYVYTENKCYQKKDGKEVESSYCEPYIKLAQQELSLSDKLIYGDLLRFMGPIKK